MIITKSCVTEDKNKPDFILTRKYDIQSIVIQPNKSNLENKVIPYQVQLSLKDILELINVNNPFFLESNNTRHAITFLVRHLNNKINSLMLNEYYSFIDYYYCTYLIKQRTVAILKDYFAFDDLTSITKMSWCGVYDPLVNYVISFIEQASSVIDFVNIVNIENTNNELKITDCLSGKPVDLKINYSKLL